MRDQIYSDETAELCFTLMEDGLGEVVSRYDLEELTRIRDQETNEHGKNILTRLLILWPSMRQGQDLLDQELAENWDEDEYNSRDNQIAKTSRPEIGYKDEDLEEDDGDEDDRDYD